MLVFRFALTCLCKWIRMWFIRLLYIFLLTTCLQLYLISHSCSSMLFSCLGDFFLLIASFSCINLNFMSKICRSTCIPTVHQNFVVGQPAHICFGVWCQMKSGWHQVGSCNSLVKLWCILDFEACSLDDMFLHRKLRRTG